VGVYGVGGVCGQGFGDLWISMVLIGVGAGVSDDLYMFLRPVILGVGRHSHAQRQRERERERERQRERSRERWSCIVGFLRS
jgi:hypothetical protein